MRLWHVRLIRALPRGFLLAQHRDCCALRGRGWGKKSPHTRYVYDHSFAYLVSYHRLIIQEMVRRQWKPCLKWLNPDYRGRFADPIPEDLSTWDGSPQLYPEHTQAYFWKCVAVLRQKALTKRVPEAERLQMECAIDAEVLVFGDESK